MDKPIKVTRRTMTDAWRKRKPFEGSNIKGVKGDYPSLGKLDNEWADRYTADARADRIAFTVVSYSTPIAWVLTDGTEVKVTQRFSVTTTKQMGLLY
jgi:hypothetical protein